MIFKIKNISLKFTFTKILFRFKFILHNYGKIIFYKHEQNNRLKNVLSLKIHTLSNPFFHSLHCKVKNKMNSNVKKRILFFINTYFWNRKICVKLMLNEHETQWLFCIPRPIISNKLILNLLVKLFDLYQHEIHIRCRLHIPEFYMGDCMQTIKENKKDFMI